MAISDLRSLSELARKSKTKAGKEVLTLDPKDVIPKGNQVRKRFEGIDELANSLRINGQVQPIIVSPRNEDGKYVIQKGERRWRAASLAGLPIEAIIDDKAYSALDETAGELVENIQRDALTPLEIANGLQKFVDEGWKKKQIAERLGKPASYVSAHLALLKMPACVREVYDKDISRDPETLNNLRQLYELSPAKAEKACSQAITNGIGRKQSRELLNKAKQDASKVESLETISSDEVTKEDVDNEAAGKHRSPQETEEGNDTAGRSTGKAGEDQPSWIQALPSDIKVYANIEIGGQQVTGYLATDRVDHDRKYCWVILKDGSFKRVPVASVHLISIEA